MNLLRSLATATFNCVTRSLLTPASRQMSTLLPSFSRDSYQFKTPSILGLSNMFSNQQPCRTLIADVTTDRDWEWQRYFIHVHRRGPVKPWKRRHPLDEKCQ